MQFGSSFAPGRVELLGNHTDYNGGVVLSAAINLGISARGRPRSDRQIFLISDGIPGRIAADLENLAASDGWADYPLGVAKMIKVTGYPMAGFEADSPARCRSGPASPVPRRSRFVWECC